MSKAVRYCKYEENYNGENCFVISSNSLLNSPYTIIKSKKTKSLTYIKNKDKFIQLYSLYFDKMVELSNKFRAEWDNLYAAYKKYDTIYIGCEYPLNIPCHIDVIIDKLKQREIKEEIDRVILKQN